MQVFIWRRWAGKHRMLLQFSCLVMSNSLQPHGLQHARPSCPLPTPGVYSNSCPLSRWCHPTISSSLVPFSSCLQSFPTSGSFQMSQLFTKMAKLLEFQLQHQSFQWIFRIDFLEDGLVGSPCSPRDPQESSPTPQFKSINSSVIRSVVFCYGSPSTLMHGPCFHLQSQQDESSLSNTASFWPCLCHLISPFPSSTFKDLCDFSWA